MTKNQKSKLASLKVQNPTGSDFGMATIVFFSIKYVQKPNVFPFYFKAHFFLRSKTTAHFFLRSKTTLATPDNQMKKVWFLDNLAV